MSKQKPESLENLAKWLVECSDRYQAVSKKLAGIAEVDMPYEKALKLAIHNLRLHLRGAEEVVENLSNPLEHEAFGNSVAADLKESFEKKPAKKPKKPSS